MKRKWLIPCIVLLPILLYGGIVIANNAIADRVEANLTDTALPAETEFVESLSAAGKFTGNGNGMQYIGALLVRSDLTAEELQTYYSAYFDYIAVNEGTSAGIGVEFDAAGGNLYTVVCFDAPDRGFWGNLLDVDLRGH